VRRVVALDIDVALLPLARANLTPTARGTSSRWVAASRGAARRFDLVVANLLADTLVAGARELAAAASRPRPAGRPGVLDVAAAAVATAFTELA
jgi:ribosomal protein L11 methylase PrmA